LRGGVVRNRL